MRNKLAIKSSMIGIVTRIVAMICSFITSRLFVQYIGVEILGINSVLSNILGFLQLAELGIGTAITYSLYQPIADHNIKEIQILMNFYKVTYRVIFIIILCLGLLMMPFLGIFVNDSTYSMAYIRNVFFLQVAASGVTYLMAYKRNLMYADQKQYISTYIDSFVNLGVTIVRIAIIVLTGSYMLYLILGIAQNLLANVIVTIRCNNMYPYLKEKVHEKYDKMDILIGNIKNIIAGRLGGWVYSSTDSVVISTFVGVVTVGMMASYYTLRNTLSQLVSSIVAPIQPMIANYIRGNKTKEQAYELFLKYTFIRFVIINVIAVGFSVMANSIVSIWIGTEYVLPAIIPVLMAADLFLGSVQGPIGEFIAVLGLFKDDRNMSIIGMLINLVTSILLVYFMGAPGVLIGTVIAQCYYWLARGHILFKSYFEDRNQLREYILKVTKYVAVTVLEIILLNNLYGMIDLDGDRLWIVLLECIGCVMTSVILIVATNFKTAEFKYLYEMVRNTVQKLVSVRLFK